jgi:hypothetical protein
MSGMIELTENIGGNLRWSSMADNASFGLEFLLQGKKDDRTKKLLCEGVEFCALLEIGVSETQSNSGLEAYLMKTTLSSSIEELSGKTPENIIEEAKKVKESLLQIIHKNKIFKEEDIRSMQHFFNEVSTPYLREAFKDMRKIEMTRRKSSNVRIGRIVVSRFT